MAVIGVGVIILCLLWASAIAVSIFLMKYDPSLAYLTLIILALAALLTAALWVEFRSDQERKLEVELKGDMAVIYDYSAVGRNFVVSLTGTALIGGLFVVFKFHVTVPRWASRLPPWNDQL